MTQTITKALLDAMKWDSESYVTCLKGYYLYAFIFSSTPQGSEYWVEIWRSKKAPSIDDMKFFTDCETTFKQLQGEVSQMTHTKESYDFVICYYDGNEDILEKVAGTYDELTHHIEGIQTEDNAVVNSCFPIIKAGNVMPASYFIWSSIVNDWVDVTTINHREY